MTTTEQRPAKRWTDASINRALRCPKPRRAIKKEIEYPGGGPDANLSVDERDLLRWIADNADMIAATHGRGTYDDRFRQVFTWALVPLTPEMLAKLEALGADREDLEDGADTEDDGITEESLGSIEDCEDQSEWSVGNRYGGEADLELDEADGEDDGSREWDEVKPDTMDRSGLEDCTIIDALAGLRRDREARLQLPEPTPSEQLGTFVRL